MTQPTCPMHPSPSTFEIALLFVSRPRARSSQIPPRTHVNIPSGCIHTAAMRESSPQPPSLPGQGRWTSSRPSPKINRSNKKKKKKLVSTGKRRRPPSRRAGVPPPRHARHRNASATPPQRASSLSCPIALMTIARSACAASEGKLQAASRTPDAARRLPRH
ncbi:uncharacterized protein K452DRAFT_157642 [Aplosporella prunicola CBS 121167]|uniref:Uncharacterized protein n=1 Tax=Aplosporella prunicola CBS 121167 TaxID=1176127 RepID=A0A6A6AWE5_9PEZI|nr:uncharacterized protein K452DRAFT_157642 [Aplosporella prunicola CBS 121167]KAF2135916.1 hypothetical protein K452DRAFT_157642 [Aplosporella prunicola CBS 121167]